MDSFPFVGMDSFPKIGIDSFPILGIDSFPILGLKVMQPMGSMAESDLFVKLKNPDSVNDFNDLVAYSRTRVRSSTTALTP